MLKKLDWYIIKKFLTTFVIALSLFTLIIVIFDIGEKLEDFIEKKAPLYDIAVRYYMNFIPTILNMFSPIFIFLSCIFFTSRLASRSEFIAMLASGMTFDRILRPYFVVAAFLAIVSFILNSWIIPYADKTRVDFENEYVRDKGKHTENVHRQILPNVFLSINSFYLDSNGTGVILEQFKGDTLVSKLYARTIKWNYQKGTWTLGNYMNREYLENGNQNVTKGRYMDTLIAFNPVNFFRRPEDINSFTRGELNSFIKAERARGAENVDFLLTEKHRRTSVPFSTFILTLIGACVSSRKARGGIGLHLFFGLVISITYLFVYQVFITYGNSGIIPPAITVWIPIVLFSGIGYYIYRKTPK